MQTSDTAMQPQPQLTSMPSTYADKALPPPPLDPVSPMAVDFPQFAETHHMSAPPQAQGFLPEVDFSTDWSSFTSTLVGGLGDEQHLQHPIPQQHPHQHPHAHPQQQQPQTMTPFTAQGGFPMTWEDLGHYSGAPGP